jgi:quinol monooxygenase YgiN
MAYVVCATWTAREGEADKVAKAIEELTALSRQEPGMLMYQPHRDPENPSVFFFYEQYRSQDDYQAHLDSEHIKRLGFEYAIPLLESRERLFFETWDL